MFDDLIIDSKRDACALVGKDCNSCVQYRGRELADLCSNLSASKIEASFHRMYPDSDCTSMLGIFVQAYFEHSEPGLSLLNAAIAVA